MKPLKVLSLFDGISCGQLALKEAGIPVDTYFASEIKTHAIQVTQENFPDTIQLGSITDINKETLSTDIDLLIGGSPCQDFSQANKERLGADGAKSGLFWEYVRLLQELKPKYFLLENVKMKKDHEAIVSEAMGVEPIKINSQLLAPQLRNRLYWTNIPFDTLESRDIKLNDILTNGFSDRDKARCLLESDSRPLSTPIKMAHRYFNTGFTTLIFKDEAHYNSIKSHFDTHFKGKSAKEIDEISQTLDLSIYDGLRYMNKQEREACQTVPAGYTASLTPNEAACVLGDGWTVSVIAQLLKGIKQ